MSQWTLFSNHGHVLLFVAREPEARLRDVAAQVGITERAVQKIIKDLQEGGFITVRKHGRCNRYRVQTRKSLRHKLESHCSVGELVRLIHEDLPVNRSAGSSISSSGTGPVDTESSPEERQVESEPEAKPVEAPELPAQQPFPPDPGQDSEMQAEDEQPQSGEASQDKPDTVSGSSSVPAAEQEEQPEKPAEDKEDKTSRKAQKKKPAKKTVDDSQGSLF